MICEFVYKFEYIFWNVYRVITISQVRWSNTSRALINSCYTYKYIHKHYLIGRYDHSSKEDWLISNEAKYWNRNLDCNNKMNNYTYIHVRLAAVLWLKYCRYRVKHYLTNPSINQSINQSCPPEKWCTNYLKKIINQNPNMFNFQGF